MADNDLLLLAAKAAGIKLDDGKWNGGTGESFDFFGNAVLDWHNGKVWNPLKDDGDAFRLMVILDFRVFFFRKHVDVVDWNRSEKVITEHFSGNNPQTKPAALRRAIVRMAAEIGKTIG